MYLGRRSAVGLWILTAQASRSGKDWARATSSVLFGLGTLAVFIGPPDVGIRGHDTAVTRVFAGIIGLHGIRRQSESPSPGPGEHETEAAAAGGRLPRRGGQVALTAAASPATCTH
jgi:hypothetical protein